jgi:peptidoglycan/xylan/chitin deacetylase (PgdA/CDA1 family)
MWRVELAMMRIIGRYPAFMRPPYGNYNDLVREASGIRNQAIVNWDFDSGDSVGVPVAQQKQRYTDIANQHPNNILALNHETYSSTVYDVIQHAVTTLKAAGYTFATVAECLNLPAYSQTGTPESRTPDWHC